MRMGTVGLYLMPAVDFLRFPNALCLYNLLLYFIFKIPFYLSTSDSIIVVFSYIPIGLLPIKM